MRYFANIPQEMADWPAQQITELYHKGKPAGYESIHHAHNACELVYVDYGSVCLQTSRQSINLTTGDCFFIERGQKHFMRNPHNRAFDFLNISFKGCMPPRIASKVWRLTADETRIIQTLKKEAENNGKHAPVIIRLKLNELILLIDRRINHTCPEICNRSTGRRITHDPDSSPKLPGENRRQYRSYVVSRALEYIRERYNEQTLNIERIATFTGISASHLRRIFRQETGRGLHEHIRNMRMENAKRLLRETPRNINEVCRDVGYNSVAHFCTIFKIHVGMTPTEYTRSLGLPPKNCTFF